MTASTRSSLVAIVLAGAVVAGPALARDAHAEQGTKTDKKKAVDKKKLAKEYTDAGVAAQDAGDYDQAIVFYEKAYEVIPHPLLVFNIGQAHRLAGRDEEALAAYQRYIAEDAKGTKVKEAQTFIKEIEPRLEKKRAEDAARKKAEEDAARKKAEEDAARKKAEEDAAAKKKGEPETRVEKKPPPPPAEKSGGWMRPTGIGVGAAGVLSLGAGVYFGLRAKSLSDELSRPGAPFDPDKVSRGESAERTMFITVGVGAALVAGGAVLFVLGGQQSSDERAVSWTPVLAPDGGGLAINGSF
jgi:tetratricopeptide (TPR) repeat protein